MSNTPDVGPPAGGALDAHHIDRSFARNVAGISGVELFWGFGLPVVLESTFLQLFLRHLGASSTVIGLLPSMFAVGVAVFSLASAYLTVRLVRRRLVVVLVHVVASLPLTALGLLLLAAGESPSLLAVFLVGYGAFCLGMGLLLPLWQDYVVRIFSDKRVLPAMSVMMTVQSVGRLAGSYAILRVVERYAFSSRSSGIVFILVSCSFAVGSLLFLLTREMHPHAPPTPPVNHTRGRLFAGALGRALCNRPFLRLLGTDLEYFALGGVIAFYANFATEHCFISPALAAGLFVAAIYLGELVTNVLLGWFDLLSIRGKYLLTKGLALMSVPLICLISRPWAFLVASFLIGISRGTRMLCYGPAVRRVAGQSDATTYFALAPVITLPLSAGIPLLNGAMLDLLAPMGAASYRIVFLAMGVVMLAGLAFVPWMRIPSGVDHQ